MRAIFVLLLLSIRPVGAQTAGNPGEESAVREVVRRYVDARELRDPKAVAALFTPNDDQLVSSGEWRKGRETLVRGMLASSEQNSGKRTIVVETVRFLTPTVALADGRYEIARGSNSETRKMWSTFVMTKSADGWRIDAIRNMLPAGNR
jgi:uncharacterized protein (TIGR02246 family)